ncbi:uncharacterized protein LOC124678500 isoform X1 [Lolium rigidum]|uniref:uncharacterized protein LOC124678500 isoform X1 n=1 Tax=Lolium rigidum TaxID=89674 RepID=UPI001F5CDAA8|nr:uncharacterized protein LOC124678500 isoform X1 [Lolium rigidum]
MLCEDIHSHAQVQSLHARSDELARSEEQMLVNLVSLESVRIAPESYELLSPLVDRASMICTELYRLSVVAGLALELHRLEHDLLPQVMDPEAKLDRGVLQAILLMKNSAIAIFDLGKAFKEAHISGQARLLSLLLHDATLRLLDMSSTIVSLREQHIPLLVQLVTALLAAPSV